MSKTAAQTEFQTEKEVVGQQAWRETVESIVVAVILAFLFRAFVAEAFVIPTGSMAPTLQGRHLDVTCDQCEHRYRTGASMENNFSGRLVTRTTCPICRYPMELDRNPPTRVPLAGAVLLSNRDSFNGDRILVSKFAYQLGEPQRWDVIVFKYPGNAKQNYIKRLVGLPEETIVIRHGDIFVSPPGERHKHPQDRRTVIARKPPSKVKSMLQLVDDTNHIPPRLRDVGWPSRWQDMASSAGWQISSNGNEFKIEGSENATSWLRYQHLVPRRADWVDLGLDIEPVGLPNRTGQLITDYYPYNDFSPGTQTELASSFGSCWVGDLAVECEVTVQSDSGQLVLDLVEGGLHHECRFDLATGLATLSIADGALPFVDKDGKTQQHPTATTPVKGIGKYRLRLANVDDQLLLWVNERLAEFSGATTYIREVPVVPRWTPEDSGDLEPAGIGSLGASLHVTRLRVLRDIYYQAVDPEFHKSEYRPVSYAPPMQEIQRVFSSPQEWAKTDLFQRRREAHFVLDEDQFFPLGDNSPQSKDARLWSDYRVPPYVSRELLIGKAILIYWPHTWRPFFPNFGRMGLIR